jgi:putative oxidoreductase
MGPQKDWAALVGRALFALTFIVSGWQKIPGWAGNVAYISSHGLPFPELASIVSIVIELGGGIAILLGWKTRWVALAYMVYLIVLTLVFHPFWSVPANQAMEQQINFLKNVAILGGAFLLFAFGPGRLSVDKT